VSVETRTQKKHAHDTAKPPVAVMVGGETHTHRRGAGLSFASAQTCEQMTAHGYQPRTATPVGDVMQRAMQWRTERHKSQHMLSKKNKNITTSKRWVHAGPEQVRAAAHSHLGVTWR
jgi:hypothetical protein